MTKPVTPSLLEQIAGLLEAHGIDPPSSVVAADSVSALAALPLTCERLWSDAQLAEFLGISKRTLERWRAAGYGPPFVRVGKARRTRPPAAIDWLLKHEFRNHAEELAQSSVSMSGDAAAFPRRRGRPRKATDEKEKLTPAVEAP